MIPFRRVECIIAMCRNVPNHLVSYHCGDEECVATVCQEHLYVAQRVSTRPDVTNFQLRALAPGSVSVQ